MHHILSNLLSTGGDFEMPLSVQRKPERVAIVVFSSDSSFAGSFNSNVAKELRKVLAAYNHLAQENIYIYTIGKKIFETAGKSGYPIARNFDGVASKPDYDTIAAFAEELIAQFNRKQIDRVEVIYHVFKNAGSQMLTREDFLPLTLSGGEGMSDKKFLADYIFEPTPQTVLEELIPKTLKLKLYTMLLNSSASEHAARVMAMQLATDNANELVDELTVEYNKLRQQAITNELLDIMGGSMK
jgi:F-type H+-transporting ATPase subunit gamma